MNICLSSHFSRHVMYSFSSLIKRCSDLFTCEPLIRHRSSLKNNIFLGIGIEFRIHWFLSWKYRGVLRAGWIEQWENNDN